MASKIKLGARPKNFVLTVTFPLPEGGEGSITCTCRYRTRTQFGEFVDALVAKSRVALPDYTDPAANTKLQQSLIASNAGYLINALDEWDVEEELNVANMERLADELPGSVMAFMEGYRAACCEGRLGN
jgi:hypothetical protein